MDAFFALDLFPAASTAYTLNCNFPPMIKSQAEEYYNAGDFRKAAELYRKSADLGHENAKNPVRGLLPGTGSFYPSGRGIIFRGHPPHIAG